MRLCKRSTESYRQGLYFIIPILGQPLCFIITGYFLIPRMGEFLSGLSVAEALGRLYGKHVRIIAAISGTLLSIGCIAMQFKVATSVMQLFFGMSGFHVLILSAAIVIIYSSCGGIRSVVFTDLLQFFTFCTIIPLICITIWQNNATDSLSNFATLSHNPLFDFKQVFDISNQRFLSSSLLFFIFLIPALDPTYFQRMAMAKGVAQAKKTFIISGLIVGIVIGVVCWTGVLLFLNNPNLAPDSLLGYMINTYTYIGLKGLTAAGIMAIVMSTADSYINSAAVLITNDIIEPLGLRSSHKSQLLLVRITSFCIGALALIFAINTTGLLHLIVKSLSFYMPVVSVPLILAILGFRSSSSGIIIIGMASGSLAVALCYHFRVYEDGEATIGMLANLIVLMIAQWFHGEPARVKSMESGATLTPLAQQKKLNYFNFLKDIKNLSFIRSWGQYYSTQEHFDFIIGLLSIITVFSSLLLTPKELQNNAAAVFNILYHSSLLCSFVFITHPMWLYSLKKENFITIFKLIAMPYTLVFVPMMLITISNFGQYQLMILFVNVMVFIFLTRWKLTIFILILCGYCNVLLYNRLEENQLELYKDTNNMVYFGITYIILLLSAVIFAFLKPKQEAEDRAEEMLEHLSHVMEDQNAQILELSTLKQTFLRNLQHETNTPITGVYSMSQALQDCYDKLSDKERKNAINTIVTSSERLISYANNLIDVSKLTNSGYTLNIRKVNLSKLLQEALRKIKRLYITQAIEEDIEIEVLIEPDISIQCDEYYIRKAFENMIINAIQYCKKGTITLSLSRSKADTADKTEGSTEAAVEFSVRDSGIGISKEELVTIFDPFTTSSKTTTPAGGRGMGLTLAKAVAQAHKGTIAADSDGETYSLFTMRLPT